MDFPVSAVLFERARQLLPGGVNSPARAFNAVGGQPPFIDRGAGAWIFDADGHRFVDYVLSYGPLLRGHAHPEVVALLAEVAARGTSFGAPSVLEIRLAESIMAYMPSLEMIRFVNSGTEATMSALRLARAFTRRDKIIKFSGGYHGHADLLLVQAGSGQATLALPDSPGVPASVVADTLVAPYNDVGAVEEIFARFPQGIAAIIVEPVAGNMGVVPPAEGFLRGLREITTSYGALLIFDEVMTGFRVHPSGAQGLYGVTPDLTALGKVIGGGLPVGAYGGRSEIMALVAPAGPMYQAGTLSGNPLAMAGGLATLAALDDPEAWPRMEAALDVLTAGIGAAAAAAGVPIVQNRVGTMFCTFFQDAAVTDFESALRSDTKRFAHYFWAMLERGVYLPPSQFEACFLSTAHGEAEVATTIAAAEGAFATVAAAVGSG